MQTFDPNSQDRIPIFKDMPPVLATLTLLIIGVTLLQLLGPSGIENWLLSAGGIMNPVYETSIDRPFGEWPPLVFHIFLHGGLFHLGMNMAAMLSFGRPVANAMGRSVKAGIAFLLFFAVCAIAGAFAQYGQYALEGGGWTIGASSAISGLLPAAGWLQGGFKRACEVALPWALINLGLAAFGYFGSADSLPFWIAWAAHLGGLAAGFSFPLFLRWAQT